MPQTPARVEVRETGPKISRPTIIVGVPDAGLVGMIACGYVVEKLGLEPRGYIDSDLMPQAMVVHDSVPGYPVQIFGKDGVLVVLSQVPLPPKPSLELAKAIPKWAKDRDAKLVIGVSGAPSRKREDAQGEGKPEVIGISSDDATLEGLKALGTSPLEQGLITGFYASLAKYCIVNEQTSATLLGESMLQFPDPAAAAAVIDVLAPMIQVKIDTKPLLKESEEVRLRTRELMQETQRASQQPSGSPSAYR